jgi:hypothetical protein
MADIGTKKVKVIPPISLQHVMLMRHKLADGFCQALMLIAAPGRPCGLSPLGTTPTMGVSAIYSRPYIFWQVMPGIELIAGFCRTSGIYGGFCRVFVWLLSGYAGEAWQVSVRRHLRRLGREDHPRCCPSLPLRHAP